MQREFKKSKKKINRIIKHKQNKIYGDFSSYYVHRKQRNYITVIVISLIESVE